ncbi:MAG: hypothetical protein O7G88_21620 [bacterium]|nr:hypothetical protein [bacterium]
MKQVGVLAVLVVSLCVACATVPMRFSGAYDRLNRVYVNDAIGFRLVFPPYWAVAVKPRYFTVPVRLRADQEQVLEAYDQASRLGLVMVVQEGPLLEIAELVQRMQAMPETHVNEHLRRPQAAGVQQSIGKIIINGQAVAEWIYTATDTTGGVAVEVTVKSYIYKLGEYYVYLTFSITAAQETVAQPAIKAILDAFQPITAKNALQAM